MNLIHKIIQKFKCNHDYKFVRNIYGDAIELHGGYRSIWQCQKCGKYKYRKEPYIKTPLRKQLNEVYEKYLDDSFEEWKEQNSKTLNTIEDQLMKNASIGIRKISIVIPIDDTKHDSDNYYKWFTENGLEYDKTCLSDDDYDVKNVKYEIYYE